MLPAKRRGFFCWPSREDVQCVNRKFILKSGFIPNCVNSGRMWFISEEKAIAEQYHLFSESFF